MLVPPRQGFQILGQSFLPNGVNNPHSLLNYNFFCSDQQKKFFVSKTKLKQAHSYCKRILESTKLVYANKVVGNLSV